MVASTELGAFDEVSLTVVKGTAHVVYSIPSGLFVRSLDARGAPASEARRLGPPCPAGIASATDSDSLFIACGRPGSLERADTGAVVLYTVGEAVTRTSITSQLGPQSDGVSVAVRADDLAVGWHDADVGSQRAFLYRAKDGTAPTTRTLETHGAAVDAPALIFSARTLFISWADSVYRDDVVQGTVWITKENLPAQALTTTRFVVGAPTLVLSQNAGVWVGYKDQHAEDTKPQLWALPVNPRLGVMGKRKHVGRWNKRGRAQLVLCEGEYMGVAPRSLGVRANVIGINRMNSHMTRERSRMQIYGHGTDYALPAAACTGDQTLITYVGRGNAAHPGSELRSVAVQCLAGR